MASAIINHSEMNYKKVGASTVDESTGVVIPNGQTIAMTRIRANGADPDVYVLVVYDYSGGSEKIFTSTRGDVDLLLDPSNPDNQITGDGVKILKIVIVNDKSILSPIVGGSFEATNI